MIPKRTLEFLDRHLPRGYAHLVQRRLRRPCNVKQIYMVRNQQRYTEDIALALLAVARAEKLRQERLQEKLKAIA